MSNERFIYGDDEHTDKDEYWYHMQKRFGSMVKLRNLLQEFNDDPEYIGDEIPVGQDILDMVNAAVQAVYNDFCRNGFQSDADIVVYDALHPPPPLEKKDWVLPKS